MAELVHLPLVAATSITTSISNPRPRMASRNNSIDPPGNLVHNINLSRNNSIDPPKRNNLENLPEEHSILLNQMIRRGSDEDENQKTLENQMTLETIIRTSLVKSVKGNLESSTKMNPKGSIEFRGYSMGNPTQQG